MSEDSTPLLRLVAGGDRGERRSPPERGKKGGRALSRLGAGPRCSRVWGWFSVACAGPCARFLWEGGEVEDALGLDRMETALFAAILYGNTCPKYGFAPAARESAHLVIARPETEALIAFYTARATFGAALAPREVFALAGELRSAAREAGASDTSWLEDQRLAVELMGAGKRAEDLR